MTRSRSLSSLLPRGIVSVVTASEQAGLLDALDATPRTAAFLAERCATNPRATSLVLDALAGVGVCERTADGYRRPVATLGDLPWNSVREFLATGDPIVPTDDVSRRAELYASAVQHLAESFEVIARALAEKLRPASTVLDVGCGSGVWSLAMAERNADTHVTGLDFADVLRVFERRASALGLSTRAKGVVGDYLSDSRELAGNVFDRVVLANVLHLETEPTAAAMVQRWGSMLAPGGELVVIDCIPDGSPDEETLRAFYALHLGMRCERGGVHSEAMLRACCVAAGLPDIHVVRIENAPAVGALVARRAG